MPSSFENLFAHPLCAPVFDEDVYYQQKASRYYIPTNISPVQNELRAGLDDLEKILDPTGTRTPAPRVVQPLASRYTDYAIPEYLDKSTI
jgi:hypothetical protein